MFVWFDLSIYIISIFIGKNTWNEKDDEGENFDSIKITRLPLINQQPAGLTACCAGSLNRQSNRMDSSTAVSSIK